MSAGAGFVVAFPAAVNDCGAVVDPGRYMKRAGLVGVPWVLRPSLAHRFGTAAAAMVAADNLNGGARIRDRFGRRWCVCSLEGGGGCCPVVLVDCEVPARRRPSLGCANR